MKDKEKTIPEKTEAAQASDTRSAAAPVEVRTMTAEQLEARQAEIREELRTGRGTQFDPEFADIMLDMMARGMIRPGKDIFHKANKINFR